MTAHTSESVSTDAAPSREGVAGMFDRIAERYDLLNRVLSFGRDIAWRNRLVRALPQRGNLHVLDLATGTADVLLACARRGPGVARGVGLDPSAGMLGHGARKIRRAGLDGTLTLFQGDGATLPYADATFDATTIAFGIRNYADYEAGLREMHRVVKPDGRALILEFSLPANAAFRTLYLFYFRNILPRIGGLLSGDFAAYSYLNRTVETFPYGEAFCDKMRRSGFKTVEAHPLTFGIATLYIADK